MKSFAFPLGRLLSAAVLAVLTVASAHAQDKKPNIIVIMPDDVGYWNLSAYHNGMMGGRTPNIDRITHEGARFTDAYAQQSCTAGRSAFITGQSPFRTGLLKVGLPGAKEGLQEKDPTIAELLKPLGYATAQIGKNHLGDRNEHLPTVHGFDEFFGNLYHLNSEEEPEDPQYPKDPKFYETFGPRGVLDCKATDTDDPTEDPRFGRIGKQTCKDTGPLTRKRMETVEEEFVERAVDFMDRSVAAGKPFFLWFNPTRMHVWTHLSPKWADKSGYGLFADGMMELDWEVGELLKQVDDLGIADNTIVIFTTDNGVQHSAWPDGGIGPFRGEKGTTWEGGFRVPMVVKWPGTIEPGTIVNDTFSFEDWLPTLVAGAGDPNVKEKLLNGMKAGNKDFKVHLDGYNFVPFFKGEADQGPRREFFYFTDNADLHAVRLGDWKILFKTIDGNLFSGQVRETNVPLVVNLRMDPFERMMDEGGGYQRWWGEKLFTMIPATVVVGQFLDTFKEYPPSQATGSIKVEDALKALQSGSSGGGD
jgi:arylsulfatase A-like enzyme